MKENTDAFADFLLWRAKLVIWFLIFWAWYSGTPINLSTPYLHSNVLFYSCSFSKQCSVDLSLTPTLCIWTMWFYFLYSCCIFALSQISYCCISFVDYIPTVPSSEKHCRVVEASGAIHTKQPAHWKSFIPLLHTFLQLLPGTCLELEMHTAHLNEWINYVYYHKPCECYTQCPTTTITVTPATTVHLVYCMEQYLC